MVENTSSGIDGASTQGEAGRSELTNGAFYAKTMFDRHQVPSSNRSRLAQSVLKIAYSAAHLRVKGDRPMSFEDLAALAAHFGETLDDVFWGAALGKSVEATFVAGGVRFPCQLWIGDAVASPAEGSLMATREGLKWVAGVATESAAGQRYGILRLLLDPQPGTQRARIAVLDDQLQVTEGLCSYLQKSGFRADAFHTIGALEASVATLPYDAYVLDWVIGDETVGDLVERIRALDPSCPIAVLTGHATDREEVGSEIAELVDKHRIHYFSKPVAPRMIAAVLSREIRDQGRA